ncbi:cytochrome P460 family protein [Bradyrhizobium sp. Pha-3]|uniref:cytochrome P460 family protein n=1 Tax=Bradyrhizobium sp. Pha-3 TaxID=208375 RepID=UPI0035D4A500
MRVVTVVVYSTALAAMVSIFANGPVRSIAALSELRGDALADTNGNLRVPNDYRTAYEFFGTWAAAADQGQGSQELHFVYASPGATARYRKDGHFPDGTVLVKEVYRAVTEPMTTGTISHADGLRGWFVMMKDSAGRYSANTPIWGDGWGWSWFDAGNPSTPSLNLPLPGGGVAATNDYRENCKSCHQPAQATDWIYVDGYPALKR